MAPKTPIYADHPFNLVPIPGLGTPPQDLPIALFIAQDMACAHNGLLRTLNSIYLQAPHITTPKDIRDFLLYTKFWCGWIEEHHTLEESSLFPQLEELSGVAGLMEANVAQHNAFMSGLLALEKYAKETSVEAYDGSKIVKIIDDFGHVFSEHLTDEIQTLLELEKYDAAKLKEIYNNFEVQLRNGDKVSLLKPSFSPPIITHILRY